MSSGYAGNAVDVAQELAVDHVENLIHEARTYFPGVVKTECDECGEEIPAARIEALKDVGCTHCVDCQEVRDRIPRPKIRMLDHIL